MSKEEQPKSTKSKKGGEATGFELPLMESWWQLKVVDGDCRLLESNHRNQDSFTAANRVFWHQ